MCLEFSGNCSESTCGDHGKCYEPLDDGPLCIRDVGWSGAPCSLNIDDDKVKGKGLRKVIADYFAFEDEPAVDS